MSLSQQEQTLSMKMASLAQEKQSLENHVKGLRPDTLDYDLVEEFHSNVRPFFEKYRHRDELVMDSVFTGMTSGIT